MPTEQGKDAERFAAAVEQGRPLGFAVDDALARDLEIVAMLRSRRGDLDPHPDARARAKQHIAAALAEEAPQDPRGPAGPRPSTWPPYAAPFSPAPFPGPVADAPAPSSPDRWTPGPWTPGPSTSDGGTTTTPLPVVTPRSTTDRDRDAESVRLVGRAGGRARHSRSSRPEGRAGAGAARHPRRRVVLVGSAAAVLLLALTGGVFASRDTLPGDDLYGVKRVAESTGLAFTFDDAAKAHRYLEIATRRLDEVEQLVAREKQVAADPVVIREAIREFYSSTGEGSRMLLAADDAGGSDGLAGLRSWASGQATRLAQLRSALPTPAAADAEGSLDLLDRLLDRTDALENRSSCSEVTSDSVDDLGRLPAEGACEPRPRDARGPRSATSEGDENGTGSTPFGSEDPTAPESATADPDHTVIPAPGGPGPGGGAVGGGVGGTTGNGGSGPGTTEDGRPTPTTSEAPRGNGDGGDAGPLPPVTLPPPLPGLSSVSPG